MHEVSLMENTLNIALDCALAQNASKIHRLKMRVGDLSGVVPDALEFAFDVVTRGTIAEGAKFEIERVPVVCHCPNCDRNFEPIDLFYECPHCHQLTHHIQSGQEIELTSLEVS
ncbi:hydrogenase maturation nickel metallochaperone HypA [Laspinema sp. D1]|uniref:hydrogenase maturation nickel metallochaperone HypA n=1 Tax=Laspinema palackyanum TaxID=3231601 RepID=UPI003487C7D4|nr:hydrogenase maturation nickel metallochaperone HypA [Laspinema sp. D2b]